jgi:hypothetical protein
MVVARANAEIPDVIRALQQQQLKGTPPPAQQPVTDTGATDAGTPPETQFVSRERSLAHRVPAADQQLRIARHSTGGITTFAIERTDQRPSQLHEVTAGLTFRTGIIDEPPQLRGITRLVQHLVQGEIASAAPTSLLTTTFSTTGAEHQATQFCQAVLDTLEDLSLDDLEQVLQSIRTSTSGVVTQDNIALFHLYGAQGPGVAALREFGLDRVSPEQVRGWVRQQFSVDNACLWFVGPTAQPQLTVSLPSHHVPRPNSIQPIEPLPGWANSSTRGLTLTVASAEEYGAPHVLQLLVAALQEQFTRDLGYSYGLRHSTVDIGATPTNTIRALSISTDRQPKNVHVAIQHILYTLRTFAANRRLIEHLADDMARFTEERRISVMEHPQSPERFVRAIASDYLLGLPILDVPQMIRRETEQNVNSVIRLAEAFCNEAMWTVPDGHQVPDHRLVQVDRTLQNWRPKGRLFPAIVNDARHAHHTAVLAATGFSLVSGPAEQVTINFEDVAIARERNDGVLDVMDRSGTIATLSPNTWHGGPEFRKAVIARVGAERFIPAPNRVPSPRDDHGFETIHTAAKTVASAEAATSTYLPNEVIEHWYVADLRTETVGPPVTVSLATAHQPDNGVDTDIRVVYDGLASDFVTRWDDEGLMVKAPTEQIAAALRRHVLDILWSQIHVDVPPSAANGSEAWHQWLDDFVEMANHGDETGAATDTSDRHLAALLAAATQPIEAVIEVLETAPTGHARELLRALRETPSRMYLLERLVNEAGQIDRHIPELIVGIVGLSGAWHARDVSDLDAAHEMAGNLRTLPKRHRRAFLELMRSADAQLERAATSWTPWVRGAALHERIWTGLWLQISRLEMDDRIGAAIAAQPDCLQLGISALRARFAGEDAQFERAEAFARKWADDHGRNQIHLAAIALTHIEAAKRPEQFERYRERSAERAMMIRRCMLTFQHDTTPDAVYALNAAVCATWLYGETDIASAGMHTLGSHLLATGPWTGWGPLTSLRSPIPAIAVHQTEFPLLRASAVATRPEEPAVDVGETRRSGLFTRTQLARVQSTRSQLKRRQRND